MNDYEAKQERRRERLEARAAKAEAERDRRFEAADTMAGVMNGQPILIGHHSEKRHRRDIRRMDDNWRKGSEAHDQAKELKHRAASVGKGGISSDDPDALHKLRAKLENMKAKREALKKLNALWRKAGKPGPDERERWIPIEEAMGTSLDHRRAQMAACTWEKNPVASWELTNLGANIRRVEQRIKELSTEAKPREDIKREQYTVSEDVTDNRIWITFEDKPKKDIRRLIKTYGFKWSPTRVAWVRHLNARGWAMAEFLSTELDKRGELCET
jgi:hypothetical protein